jgi:hypothetical protein
MPKVARMTIALSPTQPRFRLPSRKFLARRIGRAILLLVILLFATITGPYYYLVVLALVSLALWRKRFIEAMVCLVGLPAFAVASGVILYISGSAKFHYMGLPHMEFYNIDPDYRCGNETGGCLVNGNEWISEDPYNFTVKAMISAFGPERGSYIGPYPTESDATTSLASARPLDLSAIATDQFDVGEVHVRLDKGVGEKLVKFWLNALTIQDLKEGIQSGVIEPQYAAPPTAIIWQNRVLLLKGPALHPTICAIDLNVGRPFAYYENATPRHRFPPVMWRKADDFP